MALLLLRSQKSELKLALLEPSHLPAEPKSTQSNRHELVHSDHTDSQNLPLKTQGLSAPANQDIGLPPPTPNPDTDFTFTFHFFCIGEGNGNPLQCSCLENPRGDGAWWAAVHGVAESWT